MVIITYKKRWLLPFTCFLKKWIYIHDKGSVKLKIWFVKSSCLCVENWLNTQLQNLKSNYWKELGCRVAYKYNKIIFRRPVFKLIPFFEFWLNYHKIKKEVEDRLTDTARRIQIVKKNQHIGMSDFHRGNVAKINNNYHCIDFDDLYIKETGKFLDGGGCEEKE